MISMSVPDTAALTPEEIEHLSPNRIKQLPTILDIVEYISTIENRQMREDLKMEYDWLKMNQEGKYMPVSDQPRTNIVKFFPCSQSTFTFMRGQNAYHHPCYPSIFRETDIDAGDYWLISRLRACEFILTFLNHPIVNEVKMNCKVEDMAIAQHYEIPTEYLDLTNNKWVAAFFAATYKEGNRYLPTKTGYDKGVGVVYIYRPQMHNPNQFDKISTLGFQYFERPTRQSSFVYKMEKGEDFDSNPRYIRLVFRHDTKASEMIYEMAYEQERFYPNDEWAEIVSQIKRNDYPLSRGSIVLSRQYGVNIPEEEIRQILTRNNISLTDQYQPLAHLTYEQYADDIRRWNEYGRPNINRRILPPIPVMDFSPERIH